MNNTGISRRTLAKGAAWTVPAVTAAAAAPMLAASPPKEVPPCATARFTGNPCRISNRNIYRFGFCITNNCGPEYGPLTFTVDYLSNGSGKRLTGGAGVPSGPIVLESGEEHCFPVSDWTAESQSNTVEIYGKWAGSSETTLLWTLPAPQKVDACKA